VRQRDGPPRHRLQRRARAGLGRRGRPVEGAYLRHAFVVHDAGRPTVSSWSSRGCSGSRRTWCPSTRTRGSTAIGSAPRRWLPCASGPRVQVLLLIDDVHGVPRQTYLCEPARRVGEDVCHGRREGFRRVQALRHWLFLWGHFVVRVHVSRADDVLAVASDDDVTEKSWKTKFTKALFSSP